MKNEFLGTVLAFAAIVIASAYAPVPVWLKAAVLVGGLLMLLIAAAVESMRHDKKDADR